jgi:replication-associated recombination protein RarA
MYNDPDQFIWEEKYRPHRVFDCILPVEVKEIFEGFIKQGDVPNLLLVGTPGTGKTTVARAMLDEMDVDVMMINASLKGIEMLRSDVQQYASSVSFKGKRKFVIMDEADHLTFATQPALRGFMDQYSSNCGFIFTANYSNKIIPALHSRCSVIGFSFPNSEKPKLALALMNRLMEILDEEKVTYDKKAIAGLINKYFPDNRRILNELQTYAAKRRGIDTGILSSIKGVSIDTLMGFLKAKDFPKTRQWTADNIGTLADSDFFQELYATATQYFKPQFLPQLVLLIANYEYKSNFVSSKEINFVAFCTELMVEAEWQ